MRAYAALENGIAVKIQMMRCNRRCDIGSSFSNKIGSLLSRDMFKNDF